MAHKKRTKNTASPSNRTLSNTPRKLVKSHPPFGECSARQVMKSLPNLPPGDRRKGPVCAACSKRWLLQRLFGKVHSYTD